MNIRFLLVLTAVLVIASCGQPDDAAMDGVPGCTTGNRIEITYPADTGEPSADPGCLHVKRAEGQGAVRVTFEVSPENAKDTRIEFAKGEALQSERTATDCRTPLPPKGGKPQCVVSVKGNGPPLTINIADELKTCDQECDPGETDCMKQYCNYKYSVQDIAGNHDLLDPQIITDPH